MLGITLPEHFGELTVMSKENLGDAQALDGRLDRLVWALVLLSVALALASLLVASRSAVGSCSWLSASRR